MDMAHNKHKKHNESKTNLSAEIAYRQFIDSKAVDYQLSDEAARAASNMKKKFAKSKTFYYAF